MKLNLNIRYKAWLALQETAAPKLGQHTKEVLQELGYDGGHIAAMTG